MRQKIKQNVPAPLWRAVSSARYALQRAAQFPAAAFHPWRRTSIHRLEEFNNIHRGKRCFIIGNGPSIKNTDLSLLRNEFTFGLNRVYMLFPEMGFNTSYLVVINDLVIEQFAENMLPLPIPKFFSWHSHRLFNLQKPIEDPLSPIFLHTTYTGPKFATDARERLWEGATVTYAALQLAYYMGFETAILIGVDHNFTTQGKPNTTITSQGDDPNHFNPQYFGQGVRWQLPDLETSERSYRMARQAFEADGRQVLDATVSGKLMVFPKVDYLSLFS
ncbi:MAG: 6-hydroxymethylpterin diphosphokinase MptE-like protein [Chloroflexota bacterium]